MSQHPAIKKCTLFIGGSVNEKEGAVSKCPAGSAIQLNVTSERDAGTNCDKIFSR